MHYLSEYQTFQSKNELNEAVSDHLSAHRYELNETVRNVLTVIARYSVKFPGVAHLKAATVANIIGKSEKTVRRSINVLVKLGVVKKVATIRKVSGGKGANILQILPFSSDDQSTVSTRQDAEKPTESNGQTSEITSEPYNSINLLKDTKERTASVRKPSWIPSEFFGILAAHIHSVKEIEGYWRAVFATTYRMDLPKEDREAIGIESFMETKARRHKLRNPIAYFIGVVKRKAKLRYITDLFDDVFPELG